MHFFQRLIIRDQVDLEDIQFRVIIVLLGKVDLLSANRESKFDKFREEAVWKNLY